MTGAGIDPGIAPLVSVVVIGYNQQDYAPLAVQSVLAQTHQQLECIFVDDGSTDATFDRVQSLAAAEPRLHAFKKENGGPGSARNFGAKHVNPRAEFVAFLDGDDLYHPDYLATAVRYLQAHPNVGVVIPSCEFIDASGAALPNHRRGYRWAPSSLWLPRRLSESEPATPFVTFYCGTGAFPFWVGRMSEYRRTDGWDEPLWFVEDIDMLCQLALNTEVHSIPQRLVFYRVHAKQATQAGPTRRSSGTLNALQEKWNRRQYSDPSKNRILDHACIYYRQVHLPFRALWVARRALGELLRAPSAAKIGWCAKLLWFSLRDFFYFKAMFPQSTRKCPATRFYEARP